MTYELRKAIYDLLDCFELNMDDMEEETLECIKRLYELLALEEKK